MVMMFAAFIEFGTALEAPVRIHVFADGVCPAAHATQDGIRIIFVCSPRDDGMVLLILVASVAWIIFPAASELDGNDVFIRVVMDAACLFIDYTSIYFCHTVPPANPDSFTHFPLCHI